MGEKHHHHWKIWLTLILILGIVGLLMYTDAGKKTLSLFKLPQFIKTAPKTTGTQFSIDLSSNKEAFYSQIYTVANSTFTADGICMQFIQINDLVLQKGETRCSITLNGFSGTVEYTNAGSIAVSGESGIVVLDDFAYSSSKPIKIDLEVIPFTSMADSLYKQKFSFASVYGNITRFKEDGSVKSVVYLNNNSLEISNFAGSLKLENETAILSGMTNSVKGTDFSW